jgi:hypothetical protein
MIEPPKFEIHKVEVPIDEMELTVRLVEAIGGTARPEGMSTAEAYADLGDELREKYGAGAGAAIQYIIFECLLDKGPIRIHKDRKPN